MNKDIECWICCGLEEAFYEIFRKFHDECCLTPTKYAGYDMPVGIYLRSFVVDLIITFKM